MENKYYTPEIEDLRIGYQCEAKAIGTGDWKSGILYFQPRFLGETEFHKLNGFWTLGEYLIKDLEQLRTKYLDKQDIESLGWKFKGKSIDIWFEKEGTFDMGCFTTYKIIMHYGLEDHRMFIYADDQGTEYDLFKGEIKSINELKYIQKLLGIK